MCLLLCSFYPRATSVLRDQRWPCRVLPESTNRTRALRTASRADLDSSVRRLWWETRGPALHTRFALQVGYGTFYFQQEVCNNCFTTVTFSLGTMVPQPCPNGTYTHSNQTGLQEEKECLPCPPGTFCRYSGSILHHALHVSHCHTLYLDPHSTHIIWHTYIQHAPTHAERQVLTSSFTLQVNIRKLYHIEKCNCSCHALLL